MIPWPSTDDNVLKTTVELVTGDDTCDDVETGGLLLFTDAERHCNVIARMAHLARANVGVIQIQLANQNSIEHHCVGDRHTAVGSDDRALGIAADRFKGMQGSLEGVLFSRRQCTADGIQDKKLRVLQDIVGNGLGIKFEYPLGNLLYQRCLGAL